MENINKEKCNNENEKSEENSSRQTEINDILLARSLLLEKDQSPKSYSLYLESKKFGFE